MPIVNLSQILTFAAEKGASDIHFQVGLAAAAPPPRGALSPQAPAAERRGHGG